MNIEILKCHGSNNDFVLIDEMTGAYSFSEEDRVTIAKTLCDREGIVGADGILFVLNSDVAEAQMRMFNPDGSEAEMCGNGLRCVARYVTEKLGKDEVVIETPEANLPVVKREEMYEDIPSFEVNIEPVSFNADSLPLHSSHQIHIEQPIPALSKDLTFTALSVPNPHIITVVPEVHDENLSWLGKVANQDKELLPNGVNVSYVQPLGDQKIFVRTYERGVGLTNACGTAMSASALTTVIVEMNQLNEEIFVFNRGGFVICTALKDGDDYIIKLRGNATYVYTSTVQLDVTSGEIKEVKDRSLFEAENQAYAKMQSYAQEQITL